MNERSPLLSETGFCCNRKSEIENRQSSGGHFIAHFERITRHMMSGGRRAAIEVQLDAQRNVSEVKVIAPSPR